MNQLASGDSENMNEPQSNSNQSPAKRRGPRFFWLLALLMAGMLAISNIPDQIRAWKFASAIAARESGEKARGTQMLEELLKEQPEEERYLDEQYRWNLEDEKYDVALEFLQGQFAGAKEGSDHYAKLLLNRSQLYLHLRRYHDAVVDCQELLRLSEKIGTPPRSMALNLLAYSRALAGEELDAALADADIAVAAARAELKETEGQLAIATAAKKKQSIDDGERLANRRISFLAVVDTRGVVNFKKQEFAAAQRDFDEAIVNLEQVREFFRAHEKLYTTNTRLYKTYAKKQKDRDQNDAVIYYHRSLNLKELGRDEDAARDWKRATELLGHEPNDDLF